jgi:hypothetical protein
MLTGCSSPPVTFDNGGQYYHVTDDGTFETDGPTGPWPKWCHWSRWKTPDDVTSVIDAGYVQYGQKGRVTVKSGEYFQFDGQCQPFRRVSP